MPTPGSLLLGTHVSIAGGLHNAFSRGEQAGCSAIQIFTKNASRWHAKPLSTSDITAFKAARHQSPIAFIAAHSSYLINLASPDNDKRQKSIDAFVDEIQRCADLGIESLVMHPGAHTGSGSTRGLAQLCASFRTIFRQVPSTVMVLLENTAGQGTYLGSRFEQLASIIKDVPEGHFGICLDTCHAFAAGYDLASEAGYTETIDEFDRLIGLQHLKLIHINDSKKPCGSKVDRHAHIGEGEMGIAGFKALMQDERLAQVPKILELPPGEDNCHDKKNLVLLRAMARNTEAR